MDRSAIFIDGAYLDKLLCNEFRGARLDMQAFARHLANGTEILRSYYYTAHLTKEIRQPKKNGLEWPRATNILMHYQGYLATKYVLANWPFAVQQLGANQYLCKSA